MKDLKISFPYPSTSRHNLSQDVSTSLSMGVLVPVRTVEVLPGDTHRIATSFSLISNPLVKPLLQGVRMRYCRFWVPRRIYHPELRSNNVDYDPRTAKVRFSTVTDLLYPFSAIVNGNARSFFFRSSFQASSLFDYLGVANLFMNYAFQVNTIPNTTTVSNFPVPETYRHFNVEPYLGYIDICRNYFGDSSTKTIAWVTRASSPSLQEGVVDRYVCVSPLTAVDRYIDGIQNSDDGSRVECYDPVSYDSNSDPFVPFILDGNNNLRFSENTSYPDPVSFGSSGFGRPFALSHVGLCVPSVRPDRLSRLFNLNPISSQNATVSPDEITVSNLSFLSKLQRYLTRKFFGGSRFTDLMYSVFGQKVPHVDSPILLDVFDHELGSELVASTNASESQNPGVTGGFMAARGYLKTGRGSARKKYTFNEAGYLMDLVYIMPRLSRATFIPDYLIVSGAGTMDQGNFIPDMNGIGWQQPSFVGRSPAFYFGASGLLSFGVFAFASEPSWQQYRTLPDVCSGLLNPTRATPYGNTASMPSRSVSSPFYIFTDHIGGSTFLPIWAAPNTVTSRYRYLLLSQYLYTSYVSLNDVFGVTSTDFDNIFVTFNFAHQAKRQVSKRFTLSFN